MTLNRRRKAVRWIALTLLFVLLVGGLMMARWRSGAADRWVMPDGTQVVLQAVTYGQRHEYVVGGPLGRVKRLLSRWPFLRELGLPVPTVVRQTTTNDAIVLWFEFRLPPQVTLPAYDCWVVEDATRFASRARQFTATPIGSQRTMVSATFENYPREQDRFIAQLTTWPQTPGSRDWFRREFRVANRARSASNRVFGAPEIVTDRGDDLLFELARVVSGVAAPQEPNSALADLRIYSRAEFHIREGGVPSTNWQLHRIAATGPTGNRFLALGETSVGLTGEPALVFREILWPANVPWQFQVEFVRVGSFAPEELWTNRLADVGGALAGSTGATQPLATNTINGCDVAILGLRPGSQPGSGMELSVRMNRASATMALSLVSVTDAKGETLSHRTVAFSETTNRIVKVFGIGPPTPSALKCVLAVHTNRVVELVGTPEAARLGEER